MSLRHALIGLLCEGPASGYDLTLAFAGSFGAVWPATRSQVYAELARLDDAGLLAVTAEGPRGRKTYAPTAAGLAELRRWLLETTPEVHPRSELLLRVFLLGALNPDRVTDYLAWVRERAEQDIAVLTTLWAAKKIGPGVT